MYLKFCGNDRANLGVWLIKSTVWVILFLGLTACGIQRIPQQKNQVEAAMAELTNQYKRRADLIPNLVNVVKGYASHEKETLESVLNARAKATQVQINPNKLTAEDVAKFNQTQNELSQALGRLLMITENYPNLKADTQFRDLMAQLEGTENRVTVARQRLIESIKEFNNLVTVFPTNVTNAIFFKYEKMPQWDVTIDEKQKIESPPEVKF
ncbi:MAG: LemA family protein [Bdellovibrionaceae bacterium]|nr:LemA family protein [Pseudobdellovibrionaceae bacterium]MDW8189751.1 LemA family protein [Pseudobdellovibrionaceae bacterium]